jgi:uncharacterized protein involved in type VI secretion and phage assembly
MMMPTMTQNILVFETQCSAISAEELVLTEAHGREAMSSLYQYELSFEVHRQGGSRRRSSTSSSERIVRSI